MIKKFDFFRIFEFFRVFFRIFSIFRDFFDIKRYFSLNVLFFVYLGTPGAPIDWGSNVQASSNSTCINKFFDHEA